MSTLPSDMAAEVLRMMPVKSILRFRCLSKSSCSLIDSPDFVKRQLDHSVKSNSDMALTLTGRESGSKVCIVEVNSLDDPVRLDLPIQNDFDTNIIGCCKGLFALRNRTDVVLWNPSIRKYKIIPNIWVRPTADIYEIVGLGYDAVNNDYKLIKGVELCSRAKPAEIFIYSLKSNTWRKVGDFRYCLYRQERPGVIVNDFLHWIVRTPRSIIPNVIVAFDLKNDKYHEVAMPNAVPREHPKYLAVLGGCLAMSCWNIEEVCFDVWTMSEYGVEESWNRLFTFPVGIGIGRVSDMNVLARSESGDKVLVHRDGVLCWYDVQTETVDVSKDLGEQDFEWPWTVYVSSLVSPDAVVGSLQEDEEDN